MAKRVSPAATVDLNFEAVERPKLGLADVTNRVHSTSNAERDSKRAKTVQTTSSEPLLVANEGEVHVVEAPIISPVPELGDIHDGNTDEDLELVGTRNALTLPHPRHDCAMHPFMLNAADSDQQGIQNERHCELCHCLAQNWHLPRSFCDMHSICRLTFRSPYSRFNQFEVCDAPVKDCKSWSDVDGTWQNCHCDATDTQSGWVKEREAMKSGNGGAAVQGVGDLNPRAATATRDSNRPPSPATANSVAAVPPARASTHLWTSTGSSSTTSQNTQDPPDYNFGERQIRFRIFAGDVTLNQQQHHKAAIEKSVFDSKLGKSPNVQSIMSLVAVYDEETHREKRGTDAIILESQDDIALLRLLRKVDFRKTRPSETSHREMFYLGDIAATWDEETSTGTFKIRLVLPYECTRAYYRSDCHSLLLGCWFNIFPLKLEKISGSLKASLPGSHQRLTPEVRDALESSISTHNEKVDEFMSSLTLASGCSKSDIGGYTSNDISLRGTLERYYREQFAHKDFANIRITHNWNKLSNHEGYDPPSDHDFVLSYSDRRFASLCLKNAAMSVRGNSPQTVLAQLENLGHEAELTCEGLTVELLEFQKQSLRWAMERETTPGGIQSYFWVKVPIEGVTLYFNPILGRFREDKPKTVRGGIIAEEMGLGKTIISLALILKHPAPALPVSGSHISCLANTPSTSAGTESNVLQWDSDLYSQTSRNNKLRGSVLSRGTLVVCPVSLVGQWIEEAKSKLSDPGLIYPYYGGKRIRDASKLARNAIVVTTYRVLASDDTYHRNKSLNPDEYCPPLEQIRWWRIICDEGHTLRQAGTQNSSSLLGLVADNKWVVTGTPASSSMLDLRNQLGLIGVENVYGMFQRPPRMDYRGGPDHATPGDLLFLLRNLMIRHTQKQVYRGTTTTLMSLPAKTERSIEVTLSDAERVEYDALDTAARDLYVQFRGEHSKTVSRHYLNLLQKLNPQRIACAGGHPPLDQDKGNIEEDFNDGETKPQKNNEVHLSNFCFTSKFVTLVEELKRAQDSDPTSKSLVFTHFNTTLDCLKKELPKHGFEFRTLSGSMSMKQRAKALHDFQADPPTTVFLLSMRAGNCGINLTQANRVFLMEPGFNPALEKQAIGRVHRLGQKRQVEIIRLIVKDSIETRICKFLETKYGAGGRASEGSTNEQKESGSEVESDVFEIVGNLASELPKNAMVTSEFDLLFGVESESEKVESSIPVAASMPDAAISSDFL